GTGLRVRSGSGALVADLAVEEVTALLHLVGVLAARLLVDEAGRLVERVVGLLLVLEDVVHLVLERVEPHAALPNLGAAGVPARTPSVLHRARRGGLAFVPDLGSRDRA